MTEHFAKVAASDASHLAEGHSHRRHEGELPHCPTRNRRAKNVAGHTRLRIAGLVAAAAINAACADGAVTSPTVVPSHGLTAGTDVQASTAQSAHRCINVFAEGVAPLGLIEVSPGVFTLGAGPSSVTFGPFEGSFTSIVTSLSQSGASNQGAQHITLQHRFVSPSGSFVTDDKAVCAPAGPDPNVCRVNDVLQIVGGDGVFANANGSLRNHGVADFRANSLTYSVKGRICGDGLVGLTLEERF